ncbi:unnamed protein product [Orchesella dallaii]|uniref:Uncharacterized protein n=1 Tax=Orchesella dallaii TaxID=48710 RepID=A0ABP1PI98_9HEXA
MALNETFDVTELMDNDFDIGRSLKVSLFTETMEAIIQNLIPEVIQGNWDNLSYPLSEWQKSQLENLDKQGVSCMLKMWLIDQLNLKEGTFCNATWDIVYCWPPTTIGSVASRNCSDILELMNEPYADQIQVQINTMFSLQLDTLGVTTRVCLDDGTWLRGDWTNYTHCADSYDQHTLERDLACKIMLSINLYAIVASVSWMFIEGHYIHGKLTNNFLDHKTPLEAYYVIGWIMPIGLIGVYATRMGKNDSEKCWKDYSERLELWVLLAPILLALLPCNKVYFGLVAIAWTPQSHFYCSTALYAVMLGTHSDGSLPESFLGGGQMIRKAIRLEAGVLMYNEVLRTLTMEMDAYIMKLSRGGNNL